MSEAATNNDVVVVAAAAAGEREEEEGRFLSRVSALCDRVGRAEASACHAFRELVDCQTRRYEDAVHFVYTNLVRGLMHGDRPRVQASLFAGCHTLEQLQTDWNTGRMEAQRDLLAAADDLRAVTRLLRDRFGLPGPAAAASPPAIADVDRTIADHTAETVGHKRRRIDAFRVARGDVAGDSAAAAGPHAALVAALRDPARAFGTGLSADEHRLLSTVIPECGLLPDLALMRDGWHPNLCLYSTDNDRRWEDAGLRNTPHASTFTGLILTEYVRTRRDAQRFTFIHIMAAVGFGPADIHRYLPYVEHSFYERLIADTALCFLAEAQAPKIAVYVGAEWADLMDVFVSDHTGATNNAWAGVRRHHGLSVLEEALYHHAAATDADAARCLRPPCTVLGALHRLRHSHPGVFLDGAGETAAVQALDDGFRAAVRAAGGPRVVSALDTETMRARAWPMVLRQMAVEHVRLQVRRLRLLPRSPDLPRAAGVLPADATLLEDEAVRCTAAWLWRIRCGGGGPAEDDGSEGGGGDATMRADDDADAAEDDRRLFESALVRAVAENLRHPGSVASLVAQACTEMDEAAIRRDAEGVYGAVTDAQRRHLQSHLENMERMLTAAFRHDRRLWTEDKRQRLGMDPLELVGDFRVAASGAAGPVLGDADSLRFRYMRAYRRHADDALLDADAAVTGASAMRDPTLFPDRAGADPLFVAPDDV
jgi:hypothetical protein